MAAEHDQSDGLQLQHSGGWATLLTILKESGERPQKRSLNSSISGGVIAEHRLRHQPSFGSDFDSIQLAKRVKGVSLKGK